MEKKAQSKSAAAVLAAACRPRKKKPYIYKKEKSESLITVSLAKGARSKNVPDFDRLDRLLGSTASEAPDKRDESSESQIPEVHERRATSSSSTIDKGISEADEIGARNSARNSGNSARNSGNSTRNSGVIENGQVSGATAVSPRPTEPPAASKDAQSQSRALQPGTSLAQLLSGDFASRPSPAVQEKYRGAHFPLPRSKKTLKARVEQHLDLVPRILAGDEELSFYYTLALDQRRRSRHAQMTSAERWDIGWDKFVGGFYGLKRQSFIATLVHSRFAADLARSTNKTILYWSPDMFCTYVLANEIILRLVMEDMALSKEDAEALMRRTGDYGCHVADHEDLVDDLDFGEMAFMPEQEESQQTGS